MWINVWRSDRILGRVMKILESVMICGFRMNGSPQWFWAECLAEQRSKSIRLYVYLLYIPRRVLIIPNIWHWRFSSQPHLADCLPISKECPYIVGILVGDLVMLVPWSLEEFQVMEQTARPDVHTAVAFVVLVPRFAVFCPNALLLQFSGV